MKPVTLEARLAARLRPPGPRGPEHALGNLLFLHWAYEPEAIQKTLPGGGRWIAGSRPPSRPFTRGRSPSGRGLADQTCWLDDRFCKSGLDMAGIL